MPDTEAAAQAIATYALGMDMKDFELATSVFTDRIDIDYSSVGGPARTLERGELADFLRGLLGEPQLAVHTSIGQVLADPRHASSIIAYYSVRHYRGEIGVAECFVLFGWYEFEMREQAIARLKIAVTAIEGDKTMLGQP